MSESFLFLLAPLLMSFILVGIHCYLGLHVLARGVIFVDLALAQVAALGSIIAFMLGYDHAEGMPYLISLSSTIVAALFLSMANFYRKKISQEALIGILYAFSSAGVVLLLDKMSHGTEHLKYALVGQLLWVTWDDVIKVCFIYGAVSVVHYYFRKPLIKNSFGETRNWKWDFLFYSLFGVVITSSVHIAGVLLVFAFLIVPSVTSSFFFTRLSHRLFFGWLLGIVLSTIGMFLSYHFDLPAGALIVVVFTSIPILFVLGMRVLGKR